MKNIIGLLVLSLLPMSICMAQDYNVSPRWENQINIETQRGFGTPPGRNYQQPQQTVVYEYQPPMFIVIPLYRANPALIAAIMGGEVIYDNVGEGNQNQGRNNYSY